MTCSACGRELRADMQFCPTCGRSMTLATASSVAILEARQVGAATGMRTTAGVQPAAAQQPANCVKCGAGLHEDLAFCTACGAARPASTAAGPMVDAAAAAQSAASFCVKCGVALDPASAFCTKCGASRHTGVVTAPNIEDRAKNALLLETILGYVCFLGVGHIYSGRPLLGIALMVAWWFGLAVLLALAATGVGLLLALPAFFGLPYYSGTQARNYIRSNGS